jgi:hypothetical protein
MAAYDYTNAPEQWGTDNPIPDGTIATVQLNVRPGGAGDGGLLKRSARGDCEMLDCEFIVVDGPHAKRKFWENMVVAGTSDGHAKAAEISCGKLRAILESARGIKPADMSAEARKARTAEYADFDGLRFVAKIGVEKGRAKADGSGDYPDRNYLATVITPDRKDWHAVEQVPQPAGSASLAAGNGSAVTASLEKPVWAQ